MDEQQVNRIKKLLSDAGVQLVPKWIEAAAIRKDPHLQIGVACSREMTLGDVADLGVS